MLYLTCTTITSVDLAHYRVSRAKDWVSVDCGTNKIVHKTAPGKSFAETVEVFVFAVNAVQYSTIRRGFPLSRLTISN